MKSHDGIIVEKEEIEDGIIVEREEIEDGIVVEREEIEHEVVLEPLDIPKFDHFCETSPIQRADLSLLRRFDIACGEVKYFKPEMVIPKHGTSTLEDSLKPKAISPKSCTCVRLHDKNSENCRWLEEFRREQSQLTIRSTNLLEESIDQLSLLSSEGKRSSTPTSMVDSVVDCPFLEEDHGHKISNLDVSCSQEGSSFYEIDERSTVDDDSNNHSTSLDSSTSCTPIGKTQGNTITSLISKENLIENFSNNIELYEEKSARTSVLVAMNSKQKNEHLLNTKSCSNSCTPKSLEMSNNQVSILVDDDEANVLEDADERRKSLICATKAANLSKLKWKNLDLEDLDNIKVVSKNGNIDTKCTLSFEDFCKDVGLNAQETDLSNIEQEIQGFDSLSNEKEQKSVLSPKQSNFPQFVVPLSDLQGEVDVLATRTSIYEDCKGNGGENFSAKSSKETKFGDHNITIESTCESQRTSGLTLLVINEVDFRLSPIIVEMNNIEVKKLSKIVDSAAKQFDMHNKRYPDQVCRAIEFPYMKQLKKYQNLAPRDFVKDSLIDVAFTKALDNKIQGFNGRDVFIAKIPQCKKYNLKEELGNKDVPSSNDIAIVPTIAKASCEDFKIENTSVEKARKGKEWFQQRLWCYLFENMKRAINELYFHCELELDVDQIKETLLVLDETSVDFKDLKAKVDDLNQVNEVLDLHQPSLDGSTKEDLQQRQPQAIASEVYHMACSQEQINIISSSLEAFNKVHKSPQSSSPQDRQQGDIFENLLLQNPTLAQVVVSPKQAKGLCKNASSISDSKLLTNKRIDSSYKILAPNSSSITRFMSPTASSEQRVFSRERQLNVHTSSKSALEAWKEKQNWEDILSSPLSSSSQISKSLEIGQKSTKQVHMPYKKFVSPKRKEENLVKTKKEVNEKQSCSTTMPMELEDEKVQYLPKAFKKSTRVSNWQAMRNNKLQRSMHSQQQSRKSWHEAHLAHTSRKASDESNKINEVCFVTSLHKKNKKLVLQQKLQDSKSRRIERLHTMRFKQKKNTAKEEDAQEKRHHLEAEKAQKIAEVQQRKDGTKVRQEEKIKNAIGAPEVQAIEYVERKEAQTKVREDEDELLGKNLLEGLRRNSVRPKMCLEQIKDCTMMNFDKQENCNRKILSESSIETRDQGSTSCRQTSLSKEKISSNQYLESDMDIDVSLDKSTSGRSEQASAGLISLVGNPNNTSLQAIKKRIR